MPTRKSPDKFHVGQRAMLALDQQTGHERRSGEIVTVLAQRVWGKWECWDPLGPRPSAIYPGWRYRIRATGREMYVEECMLRPIYDGEALSTWARFEKLTGLRLDKELVAVQTHKPQRSKRQSLEGEARHG